MNRRGQRGFTLIELMVALLVSSLLVGMILAIFSRMSLAYRAQQQIAGVQQVLSGARAAIELDAKQAGLGMPQGFKIAAGGGAKSPVQVVNSAADPDQVAFFYADTSVQAVVSVAPAVGAATVTFDQTAGFTSEMLVVLTTSSTIQAPVNGDPEVASFDACVLQIAAISGNDVTFATAAPWGALGNPHCTTPTTRTMMYRFVAHAYRIDVTSAARRALGVLQLSPTGGLVGADDWVELAYGFSDIQTAVRVQETPGVDRDNDGNVNRNWYSGLDTNTGLDQSTATAVSATSVLLQMTISLVAHTDRSVEGIPTAATPNLIGPNLGNPALAPIAANNALGDRPSTVLQLDPPWTDPLLPGRAIYRYVTFQVDFRNLGIGQL
jgi:prepilin-type N-terminal cleavage/methylation domain-containing protein